VIKRIKNLIHRLHETATHREVAVLREELQQLRYLVGALTDRVATLQQSPSFPDEYGVFSQFGEDGILASILRKLALPENMHSFVEFGVETFTESNCRFLMQHQNWRGLVLDGSAENIQHINHHPYWWRFDLKAVTAFVTRENINTLLLENGFSGDIGVLSIDIDGNDYWVWEAITAVSPVMVICEYNSAFGPEESVTIPYDPAFNRHQAHPSGMYWGASIAALCRLAHDKGYTPVAANSAGNNVFFVQNKFSALFPAVRPAELWRQAYFREVKTEQGTQTRWSNTQVLENLGEFPVVKVPENTSIFLRNLSL
jgi:hypothetical protein